MLTALTRNLGFPVSADSWLREELSTQHAPDLVFVQEVLPGFLTSPPAGYELVAGREIPGSMTGRTSAMLIRRGIGVVDEATHDHPFTALGTYAAVTKLRCGDEWIWLISVHASPSLVPGAMRRDDFNTRACEGGPWWSDAFLAELHRFAAQSSVPALIAGDLNEARDYDDRHNHVCAAEFFDGIGEAGYVDVTDRDWDHVERATRREPDYQLDRVLAAKTLADRVVVDRADLMHDHASDHAAIRFTLTL